MPFTINGILAVGMVRPDAVRQEFELADVRPVGDTSLVLLVMTVYFLQQNDIHLCVFQEILDSMQYKIAIIAVESFVDVVREYSDH